MFGMTLIVDSVTLINRIWYLKLCFGRYLEILDISCSLSLEFIVFPPYSMWYLKLCFSGNLEVFYVSREWLSAMRRVIARVSAMPVIYGN